MDEHTTICTVDIAGYGGTGRTSPNYLTMHAGMYGSVRRAFAESGIPWEKCFIQDMGDGILVLAPATVPKGAFVGKLPEALVTALEKHNAAHPVEEEQIKLRVALHAGEVTIDQNGVAAPAVVHACRLLDARPLKNYLKGSSGNLGLIVSDWFFKDVVRQRPEYAPDKYRRMRVELKEFDDAGWIRLPDGVLPPEPFTLPSELVIFASRHGTPEVLPVLRPASAVFYEVVDALENVPCMQGGHSRSMVVDRLRFADMVRHFVIRRAHITSILRTCLDFEGGLEELVATISELEPSESVPVKRLVAVLNSAGIHIGSRLPKDADARLLGAPTVTAVEVRRRGVDPDLHGLIRLWSGQGAIHLPRFQFTPTGEVRPLVLEINILLGVSEDPWGVADWWLGPNTWLAGVPADLLDDVDEARLRAAAVAAVEG